MDRPLTIAILAVVVSVVIGVWRNLLAPRRPKRLCSRAALGIHQSLSKVFDARLSTAAGAFRGSVSALVAQYGATGNRYGTSLVRALEELGRKELASRCEIILASWREGVGDARVGIKVKRQIVEWATERLNAEATEISEEVLRVDMGSARRDSGFLAKQLEQTRSGVMGEIGLLPS